MTNNIFTETGKPFGQYTPIPGHDATYAAGIQALDIYTAIWEARELTMRAWDHLTPVIGEARFDAQRQHNVKGCVDFALSEFVRNLEAVRDTLDEARRIADSDELDEVDIPRLMKRPLRQAKMMTGYLRHVAKAASDTHHAGHYAMVESIIADALGMASHLADEVVKLQGAEAVRKANGTWVDSKPIAQPSAADVAAAEEHARIVTEEQQHWLDRQKA